MPQGYDPQYDDPQDGTDLVKTLRDRGDKAEKRVKELEDLVTKLSGQVKTTTITDVLKAKNVNPKIAKFIDIQGDVTQEAVEAWLKENGELFGVKAEEEAAPSGESQEPAVTTDPRLAQVQAAQQRMNAVESGGQQPLADDALLAKLTSPDLTPKELYQLLGASDGPSYYYEPQSR